MNHWGHIRREITAAHKRESLRKPRAFRQSLEFIQGKLEASPFMRPVEIENASHGAGLDPATIWVIALIVMQVVELWLKWRNKK